MNKTIDIFARAAKNGVYPGGQLTVSRECQRVITASVGILGNSDQSVTHETHFDLASLTKVLATSVLLGRALERGLCELKDPIAKFVPGINPKIKLEHALEHSTGLPAHLRLDEDLPPEIPHESWDAWRHIVRSAATAQAVRPPGMKAEYSDLGFILLGAALEAMYGQPLSTAYALLGTSLFFRDRRGPPSLPLFPVSAPVAPSESHVRPGYVHDENARAMGGVAGHAGLFGTASGVLKIAEDLVMSYHGYSQGLLQPETVRRLWQPSLINKSTRTLGWDRPSGSGSSTGGLWPKHSVGHLGFTGCSLWIEPDRALIAVLVTNRVYPTRANNLIRRLRPALHSAIWDEWGKKASMPLVNPQVHF